MSCLATMLSDTNLGDGTWYSYRVRGRDTSGNLIAYTPSRGDYTVLPAPSNLTATVVSGTQVDLSWTDNSANEGAFVIERKTAADGLWTQIVTVPADTTGYSDTAAPSGSTVAYRIRADSTSGFTRSAYSMSWELDTPIVYEIPEPGAVVYRWGGDPETFYGVSATGLNLPQAALGNGSYVLTLSNLPLHSGISVWMSANAINTDPAPDVDTIELSVAGQTARSTTDFGPNPPRPPISMAIENVVHTDQTLTLTLSGSGFEAGTFPSGSDGWELYGLEVMLLAPPRVSIEGAGTVEEDGTGSATFIVRRSGPATAMVSPLTVQVRDAGGSDPGAATEGVDYQPIGSITIPAGASESAPFAVVPIDDDAAEGIEPIYQSIVPGPRYLLAAPPATAPATGPTTGRAELNDNVSLDKITVIRLTGNEEGIAHPEDVPKVNRINQFVFGVRVVVEGERVGEMVILQKIYAETDLRNPNTGESFTPDAIRARLAQTQPRADLNTYHSLFQWVDDTKWMPARLRHIDGLGKKGYQDDLQNFSVDGGLNAQIAGQGPLDWSFLATLQRFFSIEVRKGTPEQPGELIGTHPWGYRWTNSHLQWRQGNPNFGNPPPNVFLAVGPVGQKGMFYGIYGIDGLDGLN